MGFRRWARPFLLTSDSTVRDSVKAEYLERGVADTVVTPVLDGIPQRVLRTEAVERLLRERAPARLVRSLRHAVAFQEGVRHAVVRPGPRGPRHAP